MVKNFEFPATVEVRLTRLTHCMNLLLENCFHFWFKIKSLKILSSGKFIFIFKTKFDIK